MSRFVKPEDAAVGRELRHSLGWCQRKQLGIKGRQELKKLVYMDDVAAGAVKLVLSPICSALS